MYDRMCFCDVMMYLVKCIVVYMTCMSDCALEMY